MLWIGDSLSLGMIPHVAANLSDIALVQHAPWGGDGGAEETTYGLACIDFFLHSPSGMSIKPDLVLFNFGMHDGPMFNNSEEEEEEERRRRRGGGGREAAAAVVEVYAAHLGPASNRCGERDTLTHPLVPLSPGSPPPLPFSPFAAFPGQNAPPDNYKTELALITGRLQAYTAAWGAKLAFAHTTPFICTAQQDGCVQTLNHWADEVMAAASVPVLPTYEAAIAQCGEAPQASCFGADSCWCPHCADAGYVYIAGTVVSPALRAMLTAA